MNITGKGKKGSGAKGRKPLTQYRSKDRDLKVVNGQVLNAYKDEGLLALFKSNSLKALSKYHTIFYKDPQNYRSFKMVEFKYITTAGGMHYIVIPDTEDNREYYGKKLKSLVKQAHAYGLNTTRLHSLHQIYENTLSLWVDHYLRDSYIEDVDKLEKAMLLYTEPRITATIIDDLGEMVVDGETVQEVRKRFTKEAYVKVARKEKSHKYTRTKIKEEAK